MPLNNVNQDQQFGYYSSEYFTLDYKDSSGSFTPIPGVMDFSFTGSAAPPRDVISANTAPQQKLGMTRVGQLTVNATAMPQDPAWRAIRDAQYAQTLMHFRIRMNAITFFESAASNGATLTIAAQGVVNFAKGATDDGEAAPTTAGTPLGQGQLIIAPKTGNTRKAYLITNITDADVKTVMEVNTTTGAYSTPTVVSTATSFILYSPAPLQRTFSGLISQGADTEVSSESEMTTQLIVAPTVRLPDWAIYIP